jgi:hypothetical protein
MNMMKDQNKDYVLFEDREDPKLTLIKKGSLRDSDFKGFRYDRDFSEKIEVWVKKTV